MATIEDLPNKSILDMTQDELYERLREIRLSRRTPKKAAKKSTPKKQAAKSTNELIDMLSPAQKEAILNKLEGGKE